MFQTVSTAKRIRTPKLRCAYYQSNVRAQKRGEAGTEAAFAAATQGYVRLKHAAGGANEKKRL